VLQQCSLPKVSQFIPWLAPHQVPELKRNDVHVWRASLEMTSMKMEILEHSLAVDELKRAERFHFPKDKNNFIIARGLLRIILGKYLNMNPGDIRLSCGPYGKPELAVEDGMELLRFNVSHSHGTALYAVTLEREVGIDLEYICSDITVEEIAGQFFSPGEGAFLKTLSGDVRKKIFFMFWTRREALLKARGTGLAGDPEMDGGLREAALWTLKDLDMGQDYAAALAVEGRNPHVSFWQLENKG